MIFKCLTKFFCLLFAVSIYSQTSIFKVTLDAGHGGHDTGAKYSNRIEKDIALAITLKVGKFLEATPKVNVIYTRKTDVFIDLIERANIANRANSNIFVSIHCNASPKPTVFGTETYVMGMNKISSNLAVAQQENSVVTLEKNYQQKYNGFDPNAPETIIRTNLTKIAQEEYLENSISLASQIELGFEAIGRVARQGGIKQAPFMVLHKAYMPRVLIETGFISNPLEGIYLNSEEGQDAVAKAIATAIIKYKVEYFDEEIIPEPEPVVEKGLFYKIQIVSDSKKIELTPSNFNGLEEVSTIIEDQTYKYFYKSVKTYSEARQNLKEAQKNGYKKAFIVPFNDGIKISIDEAKKIQ